MKIDIDPVIEEKVRTIELSSFYPISYTTGNYYMEGPQSVIYDSFGANPRYYKNPFRLFSNITNDTIKKDEEIKDVTWEIIYYKETGEELVDDDDYNLMKNYMPIISNDNCLIPCNMYLADNGADDEKKLYPVVICRDKTENKNILWT